MKKSSAELKKMLAHVLPAIVSMPFYRKKYQIESLTDAQAKDYIVEHFYDLPFLTRDEIPLIGLASPNDGRYSRVCLTGGTSGISTALNWCDDDLDKQTPPFAQRLHELGIKAGDYAFSTVPVGMSAYGLCIEAVIRACGLQHMEFERFSPNNSDSVVHLLRTRKPALFLGTPAGLLDLIHVPAICAELQSLKAAGIAGAIASKKDIADMEKALPCPVLNILGSTEGGIFAMKTRECDGFHVFDSNVAEVEIVDADETGFGKNVLTNLCNSCMPIVRYLSGDMGSNKEECACGYKGTVFTLTGRISETCYLGGTKVGADCFEHLAATLGVNTTFQALVYSKETPQRIQLNIVDKPVPWTQKQVLDDMMHTNIALQSKIADGLVTFDIAFITAPELIGLNARGKWRRVLES